MATATATPQAPSTDISSDMAVKSENITYRVWVKLNDQGKIADVKYGTAGKDNAFWKEMESKTEYTLAFEQTVKAYKGGTIDGARAIIDNDEEFLIVVNRGIAAKFNQKIAQAFRELTDDETNLKFEVTEGVFDSLDLLREDTKRLSLSPVEKAEKLMLSVLRGMNPNATDDQLRAQIQQMFAAAQAASV